VPGGQTQLIDSFVVTPPLGAYPTPGGAATAPFASQLVASQALPPPPAALLAAGADGSGRAEKPGRVRGLSAAGASSLEAASAADGDGDGLRASVAQLTIENARLSRENGALRQRQAELHAVLGKAQRRATDQQRLARKALSALREVHGASRPELSADAAREIADLQRQLEKAHAARRQQAELVRKYEQRWARTLRALHRAAQSAPSTHRAPPTHHQPSHQAPPFPRHSAARRVCAAPDACPDCAAAPQSSRHRQGASRQRRRRRRVCPSATSNTPRWLMGRCS
jgi:hypothetical protein